MGTQVQLTAADGHQFDAYFAASSGPARGAIVLLQEIFGVNSHIRSVADDYAAQGSHVVAPALFDRVQRNLELGYTSPDTAQGMKIARQIGLDMALKDVAASIGHARVQWADLKVGVVGYCYGGSLAWLAATRLGPAAAVCYYGGQIAANATEMPRCPVMMHFGARDAHIGPEEIEKIRSPILNCLYSSTMPAMGLIATSVRTLNRNQPAWPANARSISCAITCDSMVWRSTARLVRLRRCLHS